MFLIETFNDCHSIINCNYRSIKMFQLKKKKSFNFCKTHDLFDLGLTLSSQKGVCSSPNNLKTFSNNRNHFSKKTVFDRVVEIILVK
jgi:hypothetical protein